MKHYFLGLAAGFSRKERLEHTFAIGREKDRKELTNCLSKKYDGEAILMKNGRSALALALKTYFKPGDGIIVNGFTCYAVYEAIKAAKLVPVFVDIDKQSLNYTGEILAGEILAGEILAGEILAAACPSDTLRAAQAKSSRSAEHIATKISPAGIVVQNTFGNPVEMREIEKFAKEHGLLIIEDLAHSTGVKYPDGREAGTVGIATVLSFGKDKSIDTVSGGAVVFRGEAFGETEEIRSAAARGQVPAARGDGPAGRGPKFAESSPWRMPLISDHLRARFYPLFGAMSRGLSHIHLGGVFMRLLVKIHFVEKSADSKLDLERKISKFEAKLALKQLKNLKKSGEPPLREFYYVKDREKVLRELKKHGYFFDGLWYEKPVAPERYYKKVNFPEEDCPNAVYAAKHIVNLPTYYSKKELEEARRIIKENLDES